jgi:hypothetical protein
MIIGAKMIPRQHCACLAIGRNASFNDRQAFAADQRVALLPPAPIGPAGNHPPLIGK